MTPTLEICGSAGSRPGPRRACSSYLLSSGSTRLLIDAGNGSLTNLQVNHDVADLDAVVLSHLHMDHIADLICLADARRFHERGLPPLQVFAPSGAAEHIAMMILPDAPWLSRVLTFEELWPGQAVLLGGIEIESIQARHSIDARSLAFTVAGKRLVYSGDTAPNPELVELARNADVFLSEATWLDRLGPFPDGIHLTGRQAGEQAAAAEVRRLLITHVAPTYDPADVATEAAEAFGDRSDAVNDGDVYQL